MADKKDKKKRKHCGCGKFAVAGSDKCFNCNRLDELEIKLHELRVCKVQNRELKEKVQVLDGRVASFEHKKKYPLWLAIEHKRWNVSDSYLDKFLKAIAPVADAFEITWGRN